MYSKTIIITGLLSLLVLLIDYKKTNIKILISWLLIF